MKNFWSLISNGNFKVGCTGQTVYVYDSSDNEIAKFKDLIYAYNAAISPEGDIFIVKSAEGRMAVYSLDNLKLIKKFRYSKVDGCQDDGYCFSGDGKRFYNIEKHGDSLKTALSIYNTMDFTLEKRLFSDRTDMCLSYIEYSSEADAYFLIGFFRNFDGIASKFFVARFYDDNVNDIKYVTYNEYKNYCAFNSLELMGFTRKAIEWSYFKYVDIELSEVKKLNWSLEKLWNYYFSKENEK